jgi:hypothetical protein
MPVVVVGTHADDSDGGVESLVERVVLVGGTVVADFDDVHRTERCRGEEAVLRLGAEVCEERCAEASTRALADGNELEHEARLVARLHV